MNDTSKFFLTIALILMAACAVLGIVASGLAIYESGNRNRYYDTSEDAVVVSITDEYNYGHIDPISGMFRNGHRVRVVQLAKRDGTHVSVYPAVIPDSLWIGDTVQLYTPHSKGVFNFEGTEYLIEYDGLFYRSFN